MFRTKGHTSGELESHKKCALGCDCTGEYPLKALELTLIPLKISEEVLSLVKIVSKASFRAAQQLFIKICFDGRI